MERLANLRGSNFSQPTLPAEWFYNPQVVRTDTLPGFNTSTAVGTDQFRLAAINDPIKWKTDRLILGVTLSVLLYSTAVIPGEVSLWLCRAGGATFRLGVSPPPDDGGVPGVFIGLFLSTNQPDGTLILTAGKNIGVSYGRTPLLVRTGETISFYAWKRAAGDFVALANFFSIPA
jgi:hypothetical protein